jgi:predicted aldo/keto reductase-like oxidoreductase
MGYPPGDPMKTYVKISRRNFLGGSMAALPGAGLLRSQPVELPSAAKSKVKEYRVLGRTKFRVSDIGFGTGELTEPSLLEAILDAGINYVDCSDNYGGGGTERMIGSVVRRRDRRKTFVTTKISVRKGDTKARLLEKAKQCLERLQFEYIDCLMMNMPATSELLSTPAYHDAIQELKAQGRVRFSGLSNHGPQWNEVPETMEKVCLTASADGRFDVMLFVYNFMARDQGEKILKAGKEKNIGMALMKTNPVLNYLEVQEEVDKAKAEGTQAPRASLLPRLKERADAAESFRRKYRLGTFDQVRDAAVRFVLSNQNVSTACLTIKNFEDLAFYTQLSGARFGPVEKRSLAAYEQALGRFYCRHACGVCESQCPERVPVNTIMRYNHYLLGQGRANTATARYASLNASNAAKCRACEGFCAKACPYGVPVQELLAAAHASLALA